jgi:hypothetical protein
MAEYLGRKWTRSELLSLVGDPIQVAGARPSMLRDGKAEGVASVEVSTGSGLAFTVLPGRGMDIPYASYRGRSLTFCSGSGVVSPAYFEEPGLGFLRGFFAGLLTTCGIANAGAPSVDQGRSYGLHGRLSNAGAEDVAVEQEWDGDEFEISVKGRMREFQFFGENLALTRRVQTRLGAKGFRIRDVVVNRGFDEQPLMLLYHFNFGWPLLSSRARVVGPISATEPRDDEARAGRGVEECLQYPEPVPGYKEKVFFHTLRSGADGRTFIALVNPDIGDGTPLGIVLRWNQAELPVFTQWKNPAKGCYVTGLEPGTMTPVGRGPLRAQERLPMLGAQESRSITIDFDVLDSAAGIQAVEREARSLA